jgi:DNA polymerase-3 subunit delta'
MQSGAPLRIPESTSRVNLERYPQVGASALELALVSVQETMSRIASRRMAAAICLQNLSMKLFEGYK